MQKAYIVLVAVTLFLTTLFIMSTIHGYNQTLESYTHSRPKSTRNVYDLLALEVPSDWKKPSVDEERLKILNETERAIKEGYRCNVVE